MDGRDEPLSRGFLRKYLRFHERNLQQVCKKIMPVLVGLFDQCLQCGHGYAIR